MAQSRHSTPQRCTSRFAKLIDRLMLEDLPQGKMSALREHVAGCTACRERYNRVVLATRLLDGDAEALELPAQRELDWVGEEVLQRARLVPDNQPVRRSVLRWVFAAASVAAALAIALPLMLRSGHTPRPRPDEFAARGAPTRMSKQVGLRAFCIQRRPEATDPVVFEATATPTVGSAPRCQVQDVLRFAYTNRTKMQYLFLVGLDQHYGIKWYEPHPPKRTSIKVQGGVVDEPLSRAVKLSVNHSRGVLRLFAIFSAEPLHADQIRRAVQQVKRKGSPIGSLRLLPLDSTEQRSVLVDLSQPHKTR